MKFKIKDSNIFPLPGNPHMLHLATISYGLREFIAMVCVKGPKANNCYIEEVVLESKDFDKDVWANCKFITDDNLAFDLAKFVEEKGLIDMKRRTNELAATGRLHWLLGQTDSWTSSIQ